MFAPSETIGVTWQNPKEAALYFDRILPCAEYAVVPEEFRIDYQALESRYVRLATESYHPDKTDWENFVDSIHEPIEYWDDEIAWTADDNVAQATAALLKLGTTCAIVPSSNHPWDFEQDRLLIPAYYESAQADQVRFGGKERGWPDPPDFPGFPPGGESVEVTLINMNAVDVSEAPWEQIVDFRHDGRAARQLRDLRLLFADKLEGKSETYVQDYISSKLEAYENAARKHGFETVTTTIQALFNSKSAVGLSTITAAGVISNQWGIATAAAVATAVLEIANVSLHITNRRHDFTWFTRTAELSYLHHARSRLERL